MSHKSLDERIHEDGVKWLNDRLATKGYDIVLKNPTYHIHSTDGELDVIAIRGNVMHYYEIKLNHSYERFHKAQEQYDRVCRMFPNMKIKGVYVPLHYGKIRRLR
jgi:Holliday junction resolvase-like predicted endonuclease